MHPGNLHTFIVKLCREFYSQVWYNSMHGCYSWSVLIMCIRLFELPAAFDISFTYEFKNRTPAKNLNDVHVIRGMGAIFDFRKGLEMSSS